MGRDNSVYINCGRRFDIPVIGSDCIKKKKKERCTWGGNLYISRTELERLNRRCKYREKFIIIPCIVYKELLLL